MKIQSAYRIPMSMALLVAFVAQALFLKLTRRTRAETRRATTQLVSRYAQRVLDMLNVRVESDFPYENNSPKSCPVVVISNHLSFLDIFVLSARFPSIMVTSTEMRDSFPLGWICRLGACLFVNRKNPRELLSEMGEISAVLKENISVTFFPESTSSDGEAVLPFRSALFSIPHTTGTPILPVVLNYKKVNGVSDPESFRRNVFYFGNQNLFVQLWRMLNTQSIEIGVSFLPLEHVSPVNHKRGARQEHARQLHRLISSRYRPLVSQKV